VRDVISRHAGTDKFSGFFAKKTAKRAYQGASSHPNGSSNNGSKPGGYRRSNGGANFTGQ
jgi:hypothetical protein